MRFEILLQVIFAMVALFAWVTEASGCNKICFDRIDCSLWYYMTGGDHGSMAGHAALNEEEVYKYIQQKIKNNRNRRRDISSLLDEENGSANSTGSNHCFKCGGISVANLVTFCNLFFDYTTQHDYANS
ncbi:hypothetical protein BC940DRAFT_320194 [Gongronella butleri]|nr:hypothetical protein BC940DRAFT_320194 [Gongronella butleri]